MQLNKAITTALSWILSPQIYALKDFMLLDKDALAAMVGFSVNQLKIAESRFTALYGL